MSKKRRIEQILTVSAILAIVFGCLAVLRPFISSLLWAAIICYSTWPLHRHLKKVLYGRETLAASIMTIFIAIVMVMPFVVVAVTLAENQSAIKNIVVKIQREGLQQQLPAWVEKTPYIGLQVKEYWENLTCDSSRVLHMVKSFLLDTHTWFFNRMLDIGGGIFQLSVSVFAAFFIYRDGETISKLASKGLERIAGTYTSHIGKVTGNTIKGVVYGILVTGLLQGIIAGVGFWIAGVPSAFFLGLLTFFLSFLPIGAPLIWIPASIWLFNCGHTGWSIFMALWGLVMVTASYNIIQTVLISRTSSMSFLLVLMGVIGGVIYFGFIGIFLGPTLLAIGFSMVREFCVMKNDDGESGKQADPFVP